MIKGVNPIGIRHQFEELGSGKRAISKVFSQFREKRRKTAILS